MSHKLGISNIITRITGTFVFDHQYIVYIRDQIWQTYVYVYMYINVYVCLCIYSFYLVKTHNLITHFTLTSLI